MVSLTGNTYPSTTFPLSTDSFEQSKQLAAIADLETKYSAERISCHQFEWSRSSSESHEDKWLPTYLYWRPNKNSSPSVEEIWKEWAFGMDSCLSVSELTAGWGARWRRNNSAAKTEATRRKKIITLGLSLTSKLLMCLSTICRNTGWRRFFLILILTLKFCCARYAFSSAAFQCSITIANLPVQQSIDMHFIFSFIWNSKNLNNE